MSDTPVDPPVADVEDKNATLADYEDVSGEFVAPPVSRTSSIATQVAPEELAQRPSRTLSATQEEVETDEDEAEAEAEEEQQMENLRQQKERNQHDYDGAVGFASILLVGGALLGALALYMNKPLTMGHPLTHGDYF